MLLKGKNPKGHIKTGIDIIVSSVVDNTKAELNFNNSGSGKYHPGGPKCICNERKCQPSFDHKRS